MMSIENMKEFLMLKLKAKCLEIKIRNARGSCMGGDELTVGGIDDMVHVLDREVLLNNEDVTYVFERLIERVNDLPVWKHHTIWHMANLKLPLAEPEPYKMTMTFVFLPDNSALCGDFSNYRTAQ